LGQSGESIYWHPNGYRLKLANRPGDNPQIYVKDLSGRLTRTISRATLLHASAIKGLSSNCNQVTAQMRTQQAMQNQTQGTIGAPATVARAPYAVTFNPRQAGRGFFVGYSFYFGFFGDSQTPARAGATMTPE